MSCGGRPIQVELEVRRFFCGDGSGPVATLAEQVDGLTAKHQRRTLGLRGLLERVALALAGNAGSRLARAMGQIVSRFALIRALPDPEAGQVTVLGVDDFAKRKGTSYATSLAIFSGAEPQAGAASKGTAGRVAGEAGRGRRARAEPRWVRAWCTDTIAGGARQALASSSHRS